MTTPTTRLTLEPNMTIGRWTLLRKADDGSYRWHCQCECGNEKVVRTSNLRSGMSQSCGCLRQGPGTTVNQSIRRLSYFNDFIYIAWANMVARCFNPSNPSFHNYGGRGITMCGRECCDLVSSYKILAMALGPRPSPLHSVDRIDNDGPYCIRNIRWASKHQQMMNRRVRLLTHDGVTLTVTEWAQRLGVARDTINRRLRKGWSVEDALTLRVPSASKLAA